MSYITTAVTPQITTCRICPSTTAWPSDAWPSGLSDMDDFCLNVRKPKPVSCPAVTDAKTIYADGQPIGVKVYFADGTEEKAICEEGDRPNFNLDFGITICLCKKLMGGSHNYNSAIHKIRKDMEKRAYEKALEKEREKERNRKTQEVRQKIAKEKRDAREREIEIRKEAYIRAMRELGLDCKSTESLPDHG